MLYKNILYDRSEQSYTTAVYGHTRPECMVVHDCGVRSYTTGVYGNFFRNIS
jgi:hypothetical protein